MTCPFGNVPGILSPYARADKERVSPPGLVPAVLVDTSRSAAMWALIGFLVTVAITPWHHPGEFALWFHLDDVYRGQEGHKSIDAILIGGALGVVLARATTDPQASGLLRFPQAPIRSRSCPPLVRPFSPLNH
jgi:hypothetical protein